MGSKAARACSGVEKAGAKIPSQRVRGAFRTTRFWQSPEMKLSTGVRNALADSAFGLPHTREYPMPDASHARNAKARAAEEFRRGKLSAAEKAQIDRKADQILR